MLLVTTLLCLTQLASAAKLYLAGDSTMARGNGRIEGWGQYLQPLVTIPVINRAIGGRSARSFTVEGRFDEIAKLVAPGDYVVIEFGHNDGGSLSKNDNGRTDCPGSGKEVCQSTFKGTKVTVQTFPTYMINAGRLLTGRGAFVVYSSMTPNNIFEGKMDGSYKPSRFTDYAKQAAKAVGPKASFVDHGAWTAKELQRLGRATTNQFFAQDHTHTSPAGAKAVAEAFVKAVVAANNPLKAYVKK
jgi:rhamnogalacturonan acetylesterase